MMVRKSRGFTLIELLVVIAIIGILAAMLFPVFARARESARKIQCLSNVKNIALAMQMYLTDYDKFPPTEHRADIIQFFVDNGDEGWEYWNAEMANPYLRWPVIFDEYIKNRDVWRCPSARMGGGARLIVPNYGGDWFAYFAANWQTVQDIGGFGGESTFPSGWGGTITDSIRQQTLASPEYTYSSSQEGGLFVEDYSTGEQNYGDWSTASVGDPSQTPVIADGGGSHPTFLSMGTMAYPDICCAECSGLSLAEWGWPDPNGCPDGSGGCPDCADAHADTGWAKNPDARKATARHLAGVNVGWADGHAAWITSLALCAQTDAGRINGNVGWICSPMTSAEGHAAACGDDGAGMVFMYNKPFGYKQNH